MDDDANHRNGNGRAAWIAEAVERYELPLARYAARIVHDEDRARDVVQDTFLKLCRQDRRAIDGDLGPWLYTVCRNRAVDLLRKEKVDGPPTFGPPSESHFVAAGPLEDLDAPAQSPPQLLTSADFLDELSPASALRQLSRNQQEVIRLKFQQGLKYREIAAVTGLSISNVGFLIHTGIKKLRQIIGDAP